MSIERVLVVDDEILMRNFIEATLSRKNLEIITTDKGKSAIELIKNQSFDLVITDMKLPDITGIDVLKKVKEVSPDTIVVVITAFGSIENAVEAMRLGAFNYLLKPFTPDSIEAILEKAREHISLVVENQYLKQEALASTRAPTKVIGESVAMKKILGEVHRIAKSSASVFITGESGTGKEVIAHVIHYNSPRATRPFIKVNCAAIPETLIESEFFGHEKGAFTGSYARRLGRFELADTGTLLLDEISEIPHSLQAKLLRVTQEQEFERVGGNKPIKVDVRLISTSNRDVMEMIEQKVLREDLYYRLNVIPIYLPPLRERLEDIIPLSEYFLEKICQENHKEQKVLSPQAKKKLLAYHWPGNVRELANILERVVVLDFEKQIAPEHLYLDNVSPPKPAKQASDIEKNQILKALQEHESQTKAAEALGMSLKALRTKLKEHQIQ